MAIVALFEYLQPHVQDKRVYKVTADVTRRSIPQHRLEKSGDAQLSLFA
jgi:hypothetical protein